MLDYLLYAKPVFAHKIEACGGKTVSELSAENIAAFRKSVGPLSAEKQRLAGQLKTLRYRPVVRISPKRLYWLAEEETLLSPAQEKAVQKSTPVPFTPEIEETVYNAYDYIFASFEPGDGRDIYGTAAVKLRPKILARTWGTVLSAWASSKSIEDANPGISGDELAKRTRDVFVHRVLAPDDYLEAVALNAVSLVRQMPGEERRRIFNARDGPELWKIIEPLYIARLEVKIKSFLDLDEVDEAVAGDDVYPELVEKLRKKGVPVRYSREK